MALLLAAIAIALLAVGKAVKVTVTYRQRPEARPKSMDQYPLDDEEKCHDSHQEDSILPPDFPITPTDFWNASESMHRRIDEYLSTRIVLPDEYKYGGWSIEAERLIKDNVQHQIPEYYCSHTCARYAAFLQAAQPLVARRFNGRDPQEKLAAAKAIFEEGGAFLLDKMSSCQKELSPLLKILESAYLQGHPQTTIDAYAELRRQGVTIEELKRRLAYYTCPEVQ